MLFSPAKLEILKKLKEKKFSSVGGLAKELSRPVESVSKDLKLLQAYGLLELVQNGQQKIPKLEKELLIMPIQSIPYNFIIFLIISSIFSI